MPTVLVYAKEILCPRSLCKVGLYINISEVHFLWLHGYEESPPYTSVGQSQICYYPTCRYENTLVLISTVLVEPIDALTEHIHANTPKTNSMTSCPV